jgi:hypothetical protein
MDVISKDAFLVMAQNLDNLSLIRMVQSSPKFKKWIEHDRNVWEPRIEKLLSMLPYSITDEQRFSYGLSVIEDDKNYTNIFPWLFTWFQMFLITWAAFPHVWIEGKNIINVNWWSVRFLKDDKPFKFTSAIKNARFTSEIVKRDGEKLERDVHIELDVFTRSENTYKELVLIISEKQRIDVILEKMPIMWIHTNKNGEIALKKTIYENDQAVILPFRLILSLGHGTRAILKIVRNEIVFLRKYNESQIIAFLKNNNIDYDSTSSDRLSVWRKLPTNPENKKMARSFLLVLEDENHIRSQQIMKIHISSNNAAYKWDKARPKNKYGPYGSIENYYHRDQPVIGIGAKCVTCESPDASMVCSRCDVVSYCDEECQKKDWNEKHKHICF